MGKLQPYFCVLWIVKNPTKMIVHVIYKKKSFCVFQESLREKGRTPDQRDPRQPPNATPPSKDPEVINVTFSKVKGSMGLSIVAAKVSVIVKI